MHLTLGAFAAAACVSSVAAVTSSTTESAAFFAQTTFPSTGSLSVVSVSSHTTPSSSSTPAPTSVAVFRAGGGVYTATAISSIVLVAGYQLSVGGPGVLIGGQQVSAASGYILDGANTVSYIDYVDTTSGILIAASTTVDAGTSSVVAMSTATSSTSTKSGGAAGVATAMPMVIAIGAAVAGLVV